VLEISIRAETIFSLFGLPVTNTLLMGWLVVLTLSALVFLFVRRPRIVPQGVQNVFEFAVEGVLGPMETALGGRERAEKYFPLVATIFIFILVSNWFGIFPFLGSIGVFAQSIGGGGGTGGSAGGVTLSGSNSVNLELAMGGVGGAGAQRELGAEIIECLAENVLSHKIKINLIAGVHSDVNKYFKQAVVKAKLSKELGINIHLNSEIQKVERGKKYKVIFSDGSTEDADTVICSAPLTESEKILGINFGIEYSLMRGMFIKGDFKYRSRYKCFAHNCIWRFKYSCKCTKIWRN